VCAFFILSPKIAARHPRFALRLRIGEPRSLSRVPQFIVNEFEGRQ
jgi:hypothetical protein